MSVGGLRRQPRRICSLRSITNQIVGGKVERRVASHGRLQFRQLSTARMEPPAPASSARAPRFQRAESYGKLTTRRSAARTATTRCQLSLTAVEQSRDLNGQYTLAYTRARRVGTNRRNGGQRASFASERPANVPPTTTGTAYEYGYNLLRRPPHVQLQRRPLLDPGALACGTVGWSLGGILNARSGLPREVQSLATTFSIRCGRERVNNPARA